MFYSANKKAFTIIEILVTVSILAILMTIVVGGFGQAREQSRDAQRQTDLRTIEVALTLYKNKYGVYPAGCNPPTTGNAPSWSGQPDTDYRCPGNSGQYIVGLAPEFLPKLPVDPRTNGDDSGYVYTTNEDKTVYKFMALNTVETELVTTDHQFFRCDPSFPTGISGVSVTDYTNRDPGICARTPLTPNGTYNPGGIGPLNTCTDPNNYQSTYSVSSGFSLDGRGNTNYPLRGQEYDTEMVRCG